MLENMIAAVREARAAYEAQPTQGPGSNFARLRDAACALAAASGEAPHRCMHHRYYPGDDMCMGEPSQYCESDYDLGCRIAYR